MAKHAILSASGASRWMKCPPSARLEMQFPDSESEAAREGTLAHKLAETILRYKLEQISKQKFNFEVAAIKKNPLYDEAMNNHADDFSIFVLERYYEVKKLDKYAAIFLEERLDMTRWIPEGFGTGDVVIIAAGTLDIIDLKYGKGVPVSAQDNAQLQVYGAAAMHDNDFAYDIQTVRMTIYQPRLDNIDTYTRSATELYRWAEDELRPRAVSAFAGTGDFEPGSHCRFCRAKVECRALASFNLELAKYDFQRETRLEPFEIADVLDRSELFTSWINAVKDYALEQAKTGFKWPGYKLVEGRSNRIYGNAAKIAEGLLAEGCKHDTIFKIDLLPITKLEKVVSGEIVEKCVTPYVLKPKGSPVLVPVSDKRRELNSISEAVADFENEETT